MSEAVIITGARAPVAYDLARACRSAGFDVHLADSALSMAARSIRPAFAFHRLPPPRQRFAEFRNAMLRLFDTTGAAKVIPTCEEVFWLSMAAQRDGWSERLFAPGIETLRTLHSKALFADLARDQGCDMPETHVITAPVTCDQLPFPPEECVLKPEFSRFAAHTVIAPTTRQLDKVNPTADRQWVVQRRVHGKEVCSWAALHEGRITAFAAYRPRWRQGKAAAYLVEAVDIPSVREVTLRVGAATRMTGHLSFDLIVDAEGIAHPIECNPRAVTGLHLFDASAELGEAVLRGTPCPSPDIGTLRHLGPAMTLLGLPDALRSGKLGQWRGDRKRSRDVIDRGGQPLVTIGCIGDAALFAFQAVRTSSSPSSATTADIEWDGETVA